MKLCCRSCGSSSLLPVIDLGLQPLANNLLPPAGACADQPAARLKDERMASDAVVGNNILVPKGL
ncbi:hypothetical protein [Verrucomicrobium spinosum]|uniref:hypothetical protein n=1 Tax=Verrucomicrobium spinosum TaxID=2736 RepID=UPI00155DAAB0|nr:hypothetical protein [Verrucomicrobium spinosum]